MKITWFGTASVALDDGSTKLLLDPFTRMNRRLPKVTVKDFTGFDHMLLSHGHFDHIVDVPAILREDKNVDVYCTKTPLRTLISRGADGTRLNLVAPGDSFDLGSFHITVHAGRHIDFDMPYIASVLPGCVIRFPQTFRLLYYIKKLPENGEIVLYEIRSGEELVLVMGSYGVAENETYPAGADLLVFPFSGNTSIAGMAGDTLKTLRPKRLLFTHFDDSFPPLTKRMDVEGYQEKLKRDFPEMETIVPTEKETYEF